MIEVEQQDEVAIVRMVHGKANALDLEFCRELEDTFVRLEKDADAVVLTGSRTMFSAGVDLLRALDEGAPYLERFIDTLSSFCQSIFAFSKPMIAAVNGHAIAGGCVVACMADRRLMASGSARIGVPELLVGVPFPAAPLEIMRWVIPPRYIGEVLYGGATYEGPAAMERGLIDEIVPSEELMAQSVVAARTLAGLAADAFRLTKRQLRQPSLDRMRLAAGDLDDEVRRVWCRPDTLAVIQEYVSRTFKRSG